MPAGNDHANVKTAGLAHNILGPRLKIREFPEMVHGWTVRGDAEEPEVDRDTKLALDEAMNFLNEHM